MAAPSLEVPTLTFFHLRSPYADLGTGIRYSDLPTERFGPGSLLVIGLAVAEGAWPLLADAIPRLRCRFPSIPVVLRVNAVSGGVAVQLVQRAAHLSVRAVILSGDPLEATLRQALSRPLNLAGDALEWLNLRGITFSPPMRYLVGEIIDKAESYRNVSSLLARLHVAERTARAQFHKKQLPAPGDWLDVSRGLHTALRIQRHPEKALLSTAFEIGYADHSGLSKHMRRLFQARVSEIRDCLGWEWMLDRWVTRRLSPLLGTGSGCGSGPGPASGDDDPHP